MKILFLPLLMSAFADEPLTLERITHCRNGDEIYSVYPGTEENGPGEVRIARENSKLTNPDMAPARWAQASGSLGEFHLPAYWTGPRKLTSLDCATPGMAAPAVERRMMNIHGFFTYGRMPTSPEDLEQMLQKCEAFPVDFRVLCVRDGVNPGVAGCSSITFLDTKIPVNPGC